MTSAVEPSAEVNCRLQMLGIREIHVTLTSHDERIAANVSIRVAGVSGHIHGSMDDVLVAMSKATSQGDLFRIARERNLFEEKV